MSCKNDIRKKYLTAEELEELRKIKQDTEEYYDRKNADIIEDF